MNREAREASANVIEAVSKKAEGSHEAVVYAALTIDTIQSLPLEERAQLCGFREGEIEADGLFSISFSDGTYTDTAWVWVETE